MSDINVTLAVLLSFVAHTIHSIFSKASVSMMNNYNTSWNCLRLSHPVLIMAMASTVFDAFSKNCANHAKIVAEHLRRADLATAAMQKMIRVFGRTKTRAFYLDRYSFCPSLLSRFFVTTDGSQILLVENYAWD